MLKPGYKTTEFWFTLVSFIFSGLYLTGIINDNDQKDELITIVSHAVESCVLIFGQFVIFYKYISSRNEEKIKYSTDNEKQYNIDEEKNHEQPRSNQNRNRKSNTRSTSKSSKRKKTSSKRGVEDSTAGNSKHNTNNRKTRNRSKKS